MGYESTSGGPSQLRYGKQFFYKYRLDKLYKRLKSVNLATGSAVDHHKEALDAIDAFLGKLVVFKPNHQPWVKVSKAFCSLENGVVEIVCRLQYCLRYHSSNISVNIVSSISKVEPFKCLISPPVQHKWYSNIVEASNKTLGDLKLTKESSELLIESSENLVNGYHANLVWLLHEMTQGCRWYKKSIFEEEMHIKWVDTVE